MILINFSHPLTTEQLAEVERLTRSFPERVLNVNAQFDNEQPFAAQASELVDSVGLAPHEWQTEKFLLNLPSLNFIAALVLAEVHGRTGYFPSVLRLRPVAGSTPTQFEIAEILNLQALREEARGRR